jgi:formylmethanofuran dehydrogenase subunit E
MSGCDRCGCTWASLVRGINGYRTLCIPCFDEVYRLTRVGRRP